MLDRQTNLLSAIIFFMYNKFVLVLCHSKSLGYAHVSRVFKKPQCASCMSRLVCRESYLGLQSRLDKKAQLSLTNPRDVKLELTPLSESCLLTV